MKKIYQVITLSLLCLFNSCAELDLDPLSQGSSESWYSTEQEVNLALNDLYRKYLWDYETNWRADRMSDDWSQRQVMNDYPAGAISSNWSVAELNWVNLYKGIARANAVIENLHKIEKATSKEKLNQFEAEARFIRAAAYGRLVFLWGDVPFFTEYLDIDASFKLGRTPKETVIKQVYEDFDFASEHLPIFYPANEVSRATKGAALAFKARYALYFKDYELAKNAAQSCIDLNQYELYPSFGELFKSSTKKSVESIFLIPQSTSLGSDLTVKNFYTRNAGGAAVAQPSWDLFFSYYCTDGLPIDESPLFDPQNPFDNRDPRLSETFVPFGEEFLDYIYDPSPYAEKVLQVSSGKMVQNRDSRAVVIHASYNGMTLKKGVDSDWSDDESAQNDVIIMRYADVLLMYAEAKIELNQIDSSVLEAMNAVRARAYQGKEYPIINTTTQSELRKILRIERRMEFAWENRRLDDLIRWNLAEKALTKNNFGLLDPDKLKSEVVDKGLWVFPITPQLDEDGIVDLADLQAKGYVKKLADRNFQSHQYLWPIPFKEISINSNIKQNPGY